jgi:hypothetical protein
MYLICKIFRVKTRLIVSLDNTDIIRIARQARNATQIKIYAIGGARKPNPELAIRE